MSCGSARASSPVSSSTAAKSAGLQLLHDFVDELGLLVVAAEAELLHAAKAHDDVVQAPQKVEGKKAVAGIAHALGDVVDARRENHTHPKNLSVPTVSYSSVMLD